MKSESRDLDLSYRLIRSDRKTVQLRVLKDLSLEVRAPLFHPTEEIHSFVTSRAAWVLSARSRVLAFLEAQKEAPDPLASGSVHHYRGRPLSLVFRRGRRNTVLLEGDALVVQHKEDLEPGAVLKALNRWYKKQAQAHFTEVFERCWARVRPVIQVPKPLVVIRDMKSRWGVCSWHRGRVTLGLALIRYPVEALELVIYHELCHFRHAGHDRSFYGLLEQFVPDLAARKKLLKKHLP